MEKEMEILLKCVRRVVVVVKKKYKFIIRINCVVCWKKRILNKDMYICVISLTVIIVVLKRNLMYLNGKKKVL